MRTLPTALLAAGALLLCLPSGAGADASTLREAGAQVSSVPPVGTRLTELQIKRRSRNALRVSYRLDAADGVSFELMRARPGARRSPRWVTVRSFSRPGEKGSNSFRMRARGLRVGRYMLKATPRGGSAVFERFRVEVFRP